LTLMISAGLAASTWGDPPRAKRLPASDSKPSVLEKVRLVSGALQRALASQDSFTPQRRRIAGQSVAGRALRLSPHKTLAQSPGDPRVAARRVEPLDTFLPDRIDAPSVVSGEGVTVILRKLGTSGARAELEEGKLVYQGAHAHTDVLVTSWGDVAEELLWLESKEAPTQFDYEIVSAAGATSIRIEDGGVFFTNDAGKGLVLTPPVVLDSEGRRNRGKVRWELARAEAQGTRQLTLHLDPSGLVYPLVVDPGWTTTGSLTTGGNDGTSTLLQNGKVLFVMGTDAELYDLATGTWTPAASMTQPRNRHTATLLRDGRVLVAGGQWSVPTRTVEIYDPVQNTWSSTGSLAGQRFIHTATLLDDGRVAVIGGAFDWNVYMGGVEIWDPATGVWSSGPGMASTRGYHTAVRLADGRILVTGGAGGIGPSVLRSAAIFDPSGGGSWTALPDMAASRDRHAATLLPSGNVVVTGGSIGTPAVELFNVASETWVSSGLDSGFTGRDDHTATLLPSGQVLVAGGDGATAQLFTPSGPTTGAWSSAGSMSTGRAYHTATLLPDGRVLVMAGFWSVSLPTAEIYDPATGSWSATGTMTSAQAAHTATPLLDGSVLVAGSQALGALSQRYDPASGTWSADGPYTQRGGHTATLLRDGRVLVAGGQSGGPALATAALYDPATRTWSATGSMATGRLNHTATLLPCGRVLITGGYDYSTNLTSTELYDPTTGTWSSGPNLNVGRREHDATLLSDGRVLVSGGWSGAGLQAGAEVFDGSGWTIVGSMGAARRYHTQTLLPNGRVLVTGGSGAGPTLQSAEVFNPTTGTWATTGTLVGPREHHTATLLPNGRVLLTGGWNTQSGSYLTSTELHDPAAGTFTASATLALGRESHTSTLLPDGRILVAGGLGSPGYIDTAELYDVGRGEQQAWRPILTTATNPLVQGSQCAADGSGFTGISEASGGGSTRNSSTNYPLVQLRRIDNEAVRWLPADATTNWSDASFRSTAVTGFAPGPALATVFTNGIPSESRSLVVDCAAPAIGTQPSNASAFIGGSATFSITASGGCPSYRWRHAGVPLSNGGQISGADASSLTISPVGAGDAGSYDVVVASPCSASTATSNVAILTVGALLGVDITSLEGGSGTITVTPPSATCTNAAGSPQHCEWTYAEGASVTLAASPAGDSAFLGWTGACSGTGACTVTMNSAQSVGASFLGPRVLTVSVMSDEGGRGSVWVDVPPLGGVPSVCENAGPPGTNPTVCTFTYPPETRVRLSPMQYSDSLFEQWGDACTGSAGCEVYLSGPGMGPRVEASFLGPRVLTVSVMSDEGGRGSVWVDVPPLGGVPSVCENAGPPVTNPTVCTFTYPPETRVRLSALPYPDSQFTQWGDACTGSAGCEVYLSGPGMGPRVEASFSASADVAVTKTADQDYYLPGQNLTYTLTLTNNGPAVASTVELRDTLPAGVSVVSITPTGTTCSQAGGVVTCTWASIALSATETVTIAVTTPNSTTALVNDATVTTASSDPTPVNNNASLTTPGLQVSAGNEVLSFTGTTRAGEGSVRLEWRNPASSYTRTYIRYNTAATFAACTPPADPTQGTLLVANARVGDYDTYTHTGLDENLVYCYSAFVYEGGGVFSREKSISVKAIPAGASAVWGFSTGGLTLAPPGLGTGAYVVTQGLYNMLYAMGRGVTGGERLAGWNHADVGGTVQHRPVGMPLSMGGAARVVFLARQDGVLDAIDAATGDRIWPSGTGPWGRLEGVPSGWLTAYGGQNLLVFGTRQAGDNILYGVDPTVDPPTVPPTDPPMTAWSVTAPTALMGMISGAPYVDYARQRAYFASVAHDATNNHTLWCVDLTNGDIVWSQPAGDVSGPPTYRNGHVYVGTDQGVLRVFDADTGTPVWSMDTTTIDADGGINGFIFTDRLSSRLYFSTQTKVWAVTERGTLDGADVNWVHNFGPHYPTTPVLSGNYVYVGMGLNNTTSQPGRLYEIDITTQQERSVILGDGASAVGSSVVDVYANLIYVGTAAGVVYAVQLPLN
jgi:uncharacterized repeat protein (TIGR01451 family)